jgi:hypothetical protein
MQSFKHPAQLLRSILPLLLLSAGLSACVQAPAVFLSAGNCSEFVPEEWYTTGAQSASLPATDTVGEWTAFGDAQTGKLDSANGETRDAVGIVKKCEARYQKAAESMKPKPWWHIW